MNSAVAISRIKIQTRNMPNVSWVDLLGKRKQLKRAIAEVVTGNLALWREFQDGGTLRITELAVEERKIPGGKAIEPTLIDGFLNIRRRVISERYITGFQFNGQSFPLSSLVYLRSEETAQDLG